MIFTNYGSMSGSTGPVLSARGDGTGSGGGIFSFTNTSTGTITGTTTVSTSGSVGVIFTNYGSMSASATGPVLSVRGDGTGSGSGTFSFTNTSTGAITGTTSFSTSGSTGVIFTIYGSMSGGSTGPVLSVQQVMERDPEAESSRSRTRRQVRSAGRPVSRPRAAWVSSSPITARCQPVRPVRYSVFKVMELVRAEALSRLRIRRREISMAQRRSRPREVSV